MVQPHHNKRGDAVKNNEHDDNAQYNLKWGKDHVYNSASP